MRFKLKRDQIDILQKCVSDAGILEKMHSVVAEGGDQSRKQVTVELSDAEADLVLDGLTFSLTEFGLDDHSEANEVGILIEDLIDVFNRKT